jgi:hypothetical protein
MTLHRHSAVRGALATHLGLAPSSMDALDEQRLGRDLGLDAFDLILVSLWLEHFAPERGDFPSDALSPAMTVRELDELYASWCASDPDADPDADPDEGAPDTVRQSRPPEGALGDVLRAS